MFISGPPRTLMLVVQSAKGKDVREDGARGSGTLKRVVGSFGLITRNYIKPSLFWSR